MLFCSQLIKTSTILTKKFKKPNSFIHQKKIFYHVTLKREVVKLHERLLTLEKNNTLKH